MSNNRVSKNLRRFKIRKYGIISLFVFLMFSNLVTLMQSFNGYLFVILNGILCLVRFLLYGELVISRVNGRSQYIKLIAVMIVIEVLSLVPQLLLDYEILELSTSLFYYLLLDAFSQILVIFLLVDEYVYVQSLNEDISAYHKMLNETD